jgi:plasmid stabilization system protein ParE
MAGARTPGARTGNARGFLSAHAHVAVYGVKEQTFEIVRIYHTAQDRP